MSLELTPLFKMFSINSNSFYWFDQPGINGKAKAGSWINRTPGEVREMVKAAFLVGRSELVRPDKYLTAEMYLKEIGLGELK